MRIELSGHDNRYLLECIALLFFPAAKFRDNQDDGIIFYSSLTEQDGRMTIRAGVDTPEDSAREMEEVESCSGRALHALIARTFYEACAKVTGLRPPWGTLCGIRPSKLFREFLDGGMTEEQVIGYMEDYYLARREKLELCRDVARYERSYEERSSLRDCSLYISVPFCPTRCFYCSFVSHSNEKAKRLLPAYVDLLCRDLTRAAEDVRLLGMNLRSVYMGGGTPTVLSAADLDRVLGTVQAEFDLSGLQEYTVEAGRPDCTDEEKLRVIARRGADRVSINPQTMNDRILESIGRRHTAAQTEEAYRMAREVGFKTINMDLIAGLLGETVEEFQYSVDRVLDLRPENLTVHSLCLKKNSRAKAEQREEFVRESGRMEEMLAYSQRRLREEGYEPYYLYRQKNTLGNHENTGYTLPGHEGKYNLYMMGELQTIVGAGAAAVTKLVNLEKNRIERIFLPKYPYEYIGGFDELTERNRAKLLALRDGGLFD